MLSAYALQQFVCHFFDRLIAIDFTQPLNAIRLAIIHIIFAIPKKKLLGIIARDLPKLDVPVHAAGREHLAIVGKRN